MADLRTNYKDDVLDTSLNEKRKYRMITNDDGTVSFEDVTEYLQVGDSFGSVDINKTNEEIENVKKEVDTKLPKSGGQITGKITTSDNASYETNGNIFSSIYGGNLYDLLAGHNTSINNFNNAITGLQNNKASLGSQPYFGGVTVGGSGSMSYIYSEGENVNFRYKRADGTTAYANVRNMLKGTINGTTLNLTLK